MLKKDITYTDFDGNKRTETFYFNLKNSELFEMEMSEAGGFEENVKRIISEQNPKKLIKLFKGFILASYGEKSPDGRQHFKSDKIVENFTATNAYSVLFMELAFDAVAGAEFINGLVTAEQLAEVKKLVEDARAKQAAQVQVPLPEPVGPAASLPDMNPVPPRNVFAPETLQPKRVFDPSLLVEKNPQPDILAGMTPDQMRAEIERLKAQEDK